MVVGEEGIVYLLLDDGLYTLWLSSGMLHAVRLIECVESARSGCANNARSNDALFLLPPSNWEMRAGKISFFFIILPSRFCYEAGNCGAVPRWAKSAHFQSRVGFI